MDKKGIPNLLLVPIHYDSRKVENYLLDTLFKSIIAGYPLPHHDFLLLCAILLRRNGIERFPETFKEVIINNGEIHEEVRARMLSFAVEQGELVNDEDGMFLFCFIKKRGQLRKNIVKKEIQRTGINVKKFALNDSIYYRELIKIINSFDDLTLIRWFVSIRLTFERLVHIYVKHVEETKFGDGQFKRRTFFEYKHTEILNLLKVILSQEEDHIKRHYLDVSRGVLDKSYLRGIRNFPAIMFDGNEFALEIDKNGFIQRFHQK